VPPRSERERRLGRARHDVHVAGCVLAFERALGGACSRFRGSEQSVISPPPRSGTDGRPVLCPRDLRLPGGRAPHDFLRTDAAGGRAEVERFETVRPDAIIEIQFRDGPASDDGAPAAASAGATVLGTKQAVASDLIVELDDRVARGRAVNKLERYDHFLAGWSAHTSRYGRRLEAVPVVLFVCRDRPRARECARSADSVLRACRAYAGEYPFDWEYPGRAQIVFASERDIHEGSLGAYGVPRLPPEVRVAAAHGDLGMGEARAEPRQILGGAIEA
jgi:hypothetical protein